MHKTSVSLREFSHIPRKVGPTVQQRLNALKVGQKMQDLPEELWHDSFRYYVKEDPTRNGGPNLRLIRLDPGKPSLTVTGYIFNKFVHPKENRFITPREAARLQGFPDDFFFEGTLTSVQRQVGNAVPVQLAKAVTESVLAHLDEHSPFGIGSESHTSGCFPALSLFSGAGGMDIGVLQARHAKLIFDIKACVELDHDCCKSLRKNFGKKVNVVERSICDVEPKEALALCNVESGPLPLIVGGPPCQAFSQAGKQRGAQDQRGKLIFDFLRFVQEAQPVYFVMENVANLRGLAKGELLREIQTQIERIGYNFTCSLLCAADYGAPQLRRRLFFIGVRKPYPAVQAPAPTHGDFGKGLWRAKPYVGVGEAFDGLPPLDSADLDAKVAVPFVVREALSKRESYRPQRRISTRSRTQRR